MSQSQNVSRRQILLQQCGLVCLVACLAFAGCDKSPEQATRSAAANNTASKADKSKDPNAQVVIAEVGEVKITAADFLSFLEQQNPYIRLRYNSIERKKKLLDNMVRVELLAQEAKRRGIDKDPTVLRRVKTMMVDRLMKDLQKELVSLDQVTDAETRAYYEKNRHRFDQPAKIRATQIVFKSKREAQQMLQTLRKQKSNVTQIGNLAAKLSIDKKTAKRRGDIGFFAKNDEGIAPQIREAAFALQRVGDMAGPVETPAGWVILVKTGTREPVQRTYEQESSAIRNQLFNEKRYQALKAYVAGLKQNATVSVDETKLAEVKVKGRKPAPSSRLKQTGKPAGAAPATPATEGAK